MELLVVFLNLPVLLLFGLPWFVSFLFLIFLVFAIASSDSESESYAEVSITFYLISLTAMGLIGLIGFRESLWNYVNSLDFLWFMIEYFFIGFAYMFFRWWLLIKKAAKDVSERKASLLLTYSKEDYLPSNVTNFGEWLEYSGYIPTVYKNKFRLFNWWFVWPINVIRWTFTDMIKSIANLLVKYLGRFFTKIRNAVLRSVGIGSEVLDIKQEENKEKK